MSYHYPNPSNRRASYATVTAGTSAGNTHIPGFQSPPLPSNPTSPASTTRPQVARGGHSRYSSRGGGGSMDLDEKDDRGAFAGAAGSAEEPWRARWSSELGRYDDGLDCNMHAVHPPFFTPTYLRHSRYVQRLRREWDAHIEELTEKAKLNPPHPPPVPGLATSNKRHSLSGSSSNATLNKTYASNTHRGVVQDIIERNPPPSAVTGNDDKDKMPSLPTKWNDDDKRGGLEVLGDGGIEVRFGGVTTTTIDEAASIRADFPMPRECGLYYYEITVLSKGKDGLIGMGFSSKKSTLTRLPGWDNDSWAFHGDDGCAFACSPTGKAYGPKFTTMDVVGCGVNFRTNEAFFTKNGVFLGTAFTNIKADKVYPCVGLKKPSEHLRANFGQQPFVFDIDSVMMREQEIISMEVNKADVSSLHPPDDEKSLIQKLVGQYLAHEGYVEASKAFAQDVRDEAQAAGTVSADLPISDEDDIHAIHRQKIRIAILDGDIDKALKYMQSYYPQVLQDERNKDVYFRLRCRKFIELMRRYSELQNATSASSPALSKSVDSIASKGRSTAEDTTGTGEEAQDTQMELDDQLQREATGSLEPPATSTAAMTSDGADDIDMDASAELPPKTIMKANDLLNAAIAYGRELQAEFGTDPLPNVKKELSDTFAILAYTDPKASVVGALLDTKGRASIAEEVNGAVLVSLGKPSSAALEKVCIQTNSLLDAVAAKTGGGAAFVNVWQDFLTKMDS